MIWKAAESGAARTPRRSKSAAFRPGQDVWEAQSGYFFNSFESRW